MFSTRGQLSHLVDPVVFSIQEKRIGFEDIFIEENKEIFGL